MSGVVTGMPLSAKHKPSHRSNGRNTNRNRERRRQPNISVPNLSYLSLEQIIEIVYEERKEISPW